MNTRRSLINAILSGNIEELKRMKKATNEPKIILLSFRNGNYLSLGGNEDREGREYTPEEVEELKKDNQIIFLTQAEGRISSDVCTSEEEVIRRMEEDEITAKK